MDADETRVCLYLEGYNFTAKRYSKKDMRSGKTPDFKVLFNGNLSFFCEVKSSKKDGWLDSKLENGAPGEIAGGLRNDPIFNRLTADIHKAVKQFDAVNPEQTHPNVLVLVNHDDMCGFLDLLAVLTGNFYAEDGSAHPIYNQFSQGRIKQEKCRVHLFIWLDDHKPDRLLFSQTNETHHLTLCKGFGFNQEQINIIGT